MRMGYVSTVWDESRLHTLYRIAVETDSPVANDVRKFAGRLEHRTLGFGIIGYFDFDQYMTRLP